MYFGQDVDAMIEARNAREWEEQNYIDPHAEEAEMKLGYAEEEVRTAINWLADASQEIDGHPVSYRIDSVRCELDSLYEEIKKLHNSIGKEVKAS